MSFTFSVAEIRKSDKDGQLNLLFEGEGGKLYKLELNGCIVVRGELSRDTSYSNMQLMGSHRRNNIVTESHLTLNLSIEATEGMATQIEPHEIENKQNERITPTNEIRRLIIGK